MRPLPHILASVLVSIILVIIFQLDIVKGLSWIVVGVLVGTLIDFDHFFMVLLFRKKSLGIFLEKLTKPWELVKEFDGGGKLCIPGILPFFLHSLDALLIFIISLFVFPAYYIVVGMSLLAHLILDVRYYLCSKDITKTPEPFL